MGHVGWVALQRELEWPQHKREWQNGVEGLEIEGMQIHLLPNKDQGCLVEEVTVLSTDLFLVLWKKMLKDP